MPLMVPVMFGRQSSGRPLSENGVVTIPRVTTAAAEACPTSARDNAATPSATASALRRANLGWDVGVTVDAIRLNIRFLLRRLCKRATSPPPRRVDVVELGE